MRLDNHLHTARQGSFDHEIRQFGLHCGVEMNLWLLKKDSVTAA